VLAAEIEVRSAAGGCTSRPVHDDDDDDEVEFDGVVQSRPAGGNPGVWLISGRSVLVDGSTDVDLDRGEGRVGSCVEVEGRFVSGGVFVASSLEDEDDCGLRRGEQAGVRVHGLVETLPTGGLLGQWRVNGMRVEVSTATELESGTTPFVVGACVEVSGRFQTGGVFSARKLEIEPLADCAGGSLRAGEVEFRGLATEAPANGTSGQWTIGDWRVEVTSNTEVDDDDGPLVLGACVEVEGRRRDDGVIVASEVEVETASGSCFDPRGVVNAATFADGGASPGEIMSIFGLRLGPTEGRGLEVDDERVRSELDGVRVWFDSTPAPILFARNDQVNVVAPYSIAGKRSVRVQVEWRGAWSRPAVLPVRAARPGLLTLDQSGQGQIAALTVDAQGQVAVNGPDAPASPGQAVTLFAVGMGRFSRSFPDGLVVGDELPRPSQPIRVTIGGRQAEVLYAGGAPGMVLGVVQINVLVPEGLAPSDATPVTVEVGEESSQAGTTIAVQ
jgi:uncharacterized protein (TIGR03437 family)